MSIKNIFKTMDKFLYPMLGLASYENYLEHHKLLHKDEKPLSKKDFHKRAEIAKFGQDKARC